MEKTMPDDDQIQCLEQVAYVCDGATTPEVFERVVMPPLASMPAGEILALSGLFLFRCMPEHAAFLAEYGRAVWLSGGEPPYDKPRPDPRAFLTEWEAKAAAQAELADCDFGF
jgi:hypothetical protein